MSGQRSVIDDILSMITGVDYDVGPEISAFGQQVRVITIIDGFTPVSDHIK
jgi:hypothetical protein